MPDDRVKLIMVSASAPASGATFCGLFLLCRLSVLAMYLRVKQKCSIGMIVQLSPLIASILSGTMRHLYHVESPAANGK